MSLERFERFCGCLVLDNGQRMRLEDFQRMMLADYFAGKRETVVTLPKGSGKTTLLAALALHELVSDPGCDGAVAAASRDQAGLLLRQLHGFVRRTPGLSARVQLKQREAVNRRTGGRFRVLAADVDTADGLLLTFAIGDELHRWGARGSELYTILLSAVQKRDGRMFGISTAGVREQGLLWVMRERAIELGAVRDGSRLSLRGARFAWHEWSLPDGENPHDLEAVARANPAPWVTAELLRERHDSPSMTEPDWLRFSCNRWIDQLELESVVPMLGWQGLLDEQSSALDPVCFALDLSWDRATAAIAAAGWRADGLLHVELVEAALGTAWTVERLVQLTAAHDNVGVAVDPGGPAGALVPRLEEYGLVLHPTTTRALAQSCGLLLDAITEGRLRHRGQAELTHSLAGATKRPLAESWAFNRKASLSDPTPAIASALALWGFTSHGPVSESAFATLTAGAV
jgi:Phage Terminase